MPVACPTAQDLEPIERASRDEIAALQLKRLRATLQHAYENVPHYRKAFDAGGVHPEDLKSIADLSRFPFTTKKDLPDNYPFGLLAVPRERIARLHASPGCRRLGRAGDQPGWGAGGQLRHPYAGTQGSGMRSR